MSRAETERWLAEFQARFSEVLRQPLDRSGRQLQARLELYPEHTLADLSAGPRLGARERIAVYHRQYWYRLFGVLQHEFRLTARLLGMWTFNGFASRFLELCAPSHYDIQRSADGFAAFLGADLAHAEQVETPHGPRPVRVLLEASAIDETFRGVLSAPHQARFVFTEEHTAHLPRARLAVAPTWGLVQESSALMALRQTLLDDPGEHAVPLPAPHAAPRHWVIHMRGPRCGIQPLSALHARLLEALREYPVAEALAQLERDASPDEREVLLAQTQAWLAESVQLGFWSGLSVLP